MERFLEEKGTPWQITARTLSFNEKDEIYIAKGDVTLIKGAQTLSAQEAVYNRKTEIVEVSGDVRFESGEDILTGKSGVFNLKDQTGSITGGRLFLKQNHYYVGGDHMEKLGKDTYLIKNCRLTTCDGSIPAWSITGSEVRVTVEGYGEVKGAAFRVRDVPFFYVPYMIFPAKTKRQTGLLPPRLGYSSRNGMDVELPFFWAVSDQADATFYERFMSHRGLMQGVEYRYAAKNESRGTILFDILSDRIERKDMSNPDQMEISPYARTNGTRYWLRSRTDHQLPLGLTARLDADAVSDQDYLKEFQGGLYGFEARPDLVEESGRPIEDIHSPTRRTALRISRDQQDYSLQALASYHQRPENPANDDTTQPLGGLDLAILPRPLPDLPLSVSLDSNYNYIWRDFGLKGHSFTLSPEISYPMWFGPFLEFEPSVSFTRDMQWLDDSPNSIDRQSRDAYQARARLSSAIERIYDSEWGQIKSLKHKLMPSFSYEYRVHRDEDMYQPWFEPIDTEGKVNTITLSIENFLDARKEGSKGAVTYAQLGTLSLSQGYNMDEANRDEEPWRRKEPFEPLEGVLSFMPFPNLDVNAEANWDHYDEDISFADLSLGLSVDRSGGRKDIYEVDYEYLKGGEKTLNYRVDINLMRGLSTGTTLKRDLDKGKNIDKSYWLEYMSQCWGIRLIAKKLDDDSSIMVLFRLLGLGDVGI